MGVGAGDSAWPWASELDTGRNTLTAVPFEVSHVPNTGHVRVKSLEGKGNSCRLIGEGAITSLLMNNWVMALIHSSAIMRDTLWWSGTYHFVLTHILEPWINNPVAAYTSCCYNSVTAAVHMVHTAVSHRLFLSCRVYMKTEELRSNTWSHTSLKIHSSFNHIVMSTSIPLQLHVVIFSWGVFDVVRSCLCIANGVCVYVF